MPIPLRDRSKAWVTPESRDSQEVAVPVFRPASCVDGDEKR